MSLVITKQETNIEKKSDLHKNFSGFIDLHSTVYLKSNSDNYKILVISSFSDRAYRDLYEELSYSSKKEKSIKIDMSGISRELILFNVSVKISIFTKNNGWEELLLDEDFTRYNYDYTIDKLIVNENHVEFDGFLEYLYLFSRETAVNLSKKALKKHTKLSRPVRF